MENEKPFLINIQGAGSRKLVEIKRLKMIQEALKWSKGTFEKPDKHVISKLPNCLEVYFLKPGKETNNVTRPNPHDMMPVVGNPLHKLRFDEVWSFLSKISLVDFESFKAVLTLVYRNAFLLDHVESQTGVLRYQPSPKIIDFVSEVDKKAAGVSPFGLMGLLHFLDILGWNEDVKYHVENNIPTFSGRYDFKVGRINTLLTCIRVPYQASSFVKSCIDTSKVSKEIDFMNLYTIMQQFAKSRGTCTPTQEQLRNWLSPFII
jgi:hypothetical protein